ncbi:hypothetical protein E2986_02419 [Frieseomelitta varia]|uniref:Uncharacterized protein n=1 Tax=Frieseomelitta varia TaxID=561572 RepID=A0A833VVT8_9HYME|nr:hypothetical protein E2986_02419 [Frieseomelitta varia]
MGIDEHTPVCPTKETNKLRAMFHFRCINYILHCYASLDSLLSFLSLNRFKVIGFGFLELLCTWDIKKHGVPVTLELLEDGAWSKGTNKYARLNSRNNASTSSGLDTPLQILDARTLMKQQACVSSTPGSSLDLEWEHEDTKGKEIMVCLGMPLPIMDDEKVESTDGSITQTSVNNSQPSSLTASPWSRVSTPNSLEWDPVEADMVCVDLETEQLLTEIERLTDRALKETGEWTNAS